MAEPYLLRPALASEAPAVMRLLGDTVEWLRARGSDQWSTWRSWDSKMAPVFAAGDVWLLLDADALIGTITVESSADPDFWTPEEAQDPALYLSKLTIRRDHAGQHLGDLLLSWAGDYATRQGARWLRLDAWRSNPDLHRYYLDRGWRYVRTAEAPHRRSGTLFEIDATPMTAVERLRLVECAAPTSKSDNR